MSTLQTIFQKKMGANNLRRGMNLWPPLLFAGVRILHIAPDFKRVTVQMKLRWFNRNYVGTHFGGSLYAMTDPFYMLMLMKNLGRRYYVWDYSADIRFLKPLDKINPKKPTDCGANALCFLRSINRNSAQVLANHIGSGVGMTMDMNALPTKDAEKPTSLNNNLDPST